MTREEIKLSNDPLTNICLMAPYLDEVGQMKTCAFMMGLVSVSKSEKENKEEMEESHE